MRALNHKLRRDLWRLRGQVLAIAVVLGSGVAVLVMSLSTLEALETTVEAYYERYRFAEVFARATRAPERLAARIADIPGVQHVQTRIARYAVLDVEGFAEPAIGRLSSVPEDGQPTLNQLVLRSGRWIAADRHDEVIVYEPFAEEHGLALGDRVEAVINGHRRTLEVVGTALSPEFTYAMGPGALLPDDRRYSVMWMGREALAAAYELEDAFDDVVVSLLRGVSPEPVIAQIDVLLEPYGGVSAIPRKDQISHWFVMNEIDQIRTISGVLPTIFLSVAAFLSYMVLARLIATERGEIGLLKAFGYSNAEVAWHYIKLALAIALVGCLIGSALGAAYGRFNTQVYADLFRFPLLIYRPGPEGFVAGAAVSVIATLGGALLAVRRAVGLAPAEAMRPPAPTTYHRGSLDRLALVRWLDQPTRIALRQIGRWPLRAGFTAGGIAFAVGLLVMSLQWQDSIDRISESYFFEAQHQTMTVGLADAQAAGVVYEFANLPGVMAVEPRRIVAADFSAGTRSYRGAITAIRPENRLQPIFDDVSGQAVPVPPDGLALATHLADKLRVRVGDEVWVEVLEGRRPSGFLPVASTFETTIGLPAHMDLDALNRWLQVRPTVEYLDLIVDPLQQAALFAELKQTPEVSAVMLRRAALDSFNDTLAEQILAYMVIFTGFSCALAFGVAYNSTRIALSERGRELATLRVLGFTRGEISYILLGEVALLIALAMPLGCLVGRGLTYVLGRAFDTELFRIPFVIEASSYGLAVVFVLLATAVSAALVRRRVARLDLIRVLKTRE